MSAYKIILSLVLAIGTIAAPTPYQTSNQFIQTGIRKLVSSSNVYDDSYDITGTLHKYVYFKVVLNKPFVNTPRIALGLMDYQYDSSRFYSMVTTIDLNAIAFNLSAFRIILKTQIQTSDFVEKLNVMYMAADLTNSPEMMLMNRFIIQTPGLMNNELSHYQTIMFDRNATTVSDVILLKSIVGHEVRYNSFTSIRLTATIYNISELQLRIRNNGYSLNFVVVYLIAIDKATSSQLYKNYLLYTSYFTTNNTYTQTLKTHSYSLEPSRLLIGLARITISQPSLKKSGFKYNLENNGTFSSSDYYNEISYDYIIINVTACPEGYYYKPPSECVTTCGTLTLIQNRYCITCIDHCQKCINNTHCQKCIKTRILDSQQCICQSGFYQLVDQERCEPCILVGCIDCVQIGCQQCHVSLKFQAVPDSTNNTCICVANSIFNQTSGSCSCVSKHYQYGNLCHSCHESCTECFSSGQTACLSCDYSVYRVKVGYECSCRQSFVSLCDISDADCNAAVCYLHPDISGQLRIQLLSLIKDPDSNMLTYVISLLPHLYILQQLDINQVLSLGLIEGTTISKYNYQNGTMTIQVDIINDEHNNQVSIILDLLKTNSKSFSKTPTISYNYSVVPHNNLQAKYYDLFDYKFKDYFPYFVYVLIGLSYVVFFLGLYYSKLIVSEMMGILQISYFGVFLIDVKYPLIQPIYFLQYTNGFNSIFPRSQGDVPEKIFKIGYDQYVASNLNVIVIIALIPFAVAFVFFCMFKFKRHNKERNISYCRFCIGQWGMTSVLFFLYNLCCSTAIFIKYSTNTIANLFNLSIIEIIFCFTITLTIAALYVKTDYSFFGEFKYMFKWFKFQHNFYLIQLGIRIVLGFLIGMFNDSFVPGMIGCMLFLGASLVIAIRRSYADYLHTIRVAIIMGIGFLILAMYTIIAYNGVSAGRSIQTKFPLFIIVLLYLVVLLSGGYLIRQVIVEKNKQDVQNYEQSNVVEQDQKKHIQFMRQQMQELNRQEGEKDFAKKLFLSKNRKLRKKKPRRETIDFNSQDVVNGKSQKEKEISYCDMHFNHDTLKEKREEEDNGKQLTVARIMMVDKMLRDGLV